MYLNQIFYKLYVKLESFSYFEISTIFLTFLFCIYISLARLMVYLEREDYSTFYSLTYLIFNLEIVKFLEKLH